MSGAGRPFLPRTRRAAAVLVAACLPLAPAVRPAAATVVRLAIDPAASSLTFTVSRPGETVEGSAAEFSGEVRYDPGDPARSEVTLTVRAASMRTGNRIRDRRMRGIHLEVGKHPEIVFRSTAIRVGEAGRKALLEGILDLHGVERTILFPAAIRYDNGSLAAEGELVLRLSDHGIPIPRFLWMVLDDEVRVRFRLRAMPRGAGD